MKTDVSGMLFIRWDSVVTLIALSWPLSFYMPVWALNAETAAGHKIVSVLTAVTRGWPYQIDRMLIERLSAETFCADVYNKQRLTFYVSCTKSCSNRYRKPHVPSDPCFWTALSRCFRPLTSVGFWVFFRLERLDLFSRSTEKYFPAMNCKGCAPEQVLCVILMYTLCFF